MIARPLIGLALLAVAGAVPAVAAPSPADEPPPSTVAAQASPPASALAPNEGVGMSTPDKQPPAPMALDETGEAVAGARARPLPQLSPLSMFLNADMLVKAVMLGLAFASLLTWTILIGKTAELALAGRRLKSAMGRLAATGTLNEAYMANGRRNDLVAVLVREAVQEVKLSQHMHDDAGLRERVASRFAEALKLEGRSARRGMGLLATIGSTSPFVGLFGTVWGIMNSFIGISKAQTTNLAVVAPGIAEALLATAIGLVAAIPAVIVYNHFARATKAYMEEAGRAVGAVGRLLSRDIGRSRHGIPAEAAE